jgi:hypothetical protein
MLLIYNKMNAAELGAYILGSEAGELSAVD